MATSQFTFYSFSDAGAPQLTGQSGSLINVLQGCLVAGYGTKIPAGWSNPLPNGGAYGSFMPASGSRMTLMVNDAAPTSSTAGTGGPREALMVGWENLVSYTGSGSPIFNFGSGSGQFPTIQNIQAQNSVITNGIVPSGSFMVRKSATADGFIRPWCMFADAYTMYLFIRPGDDSPSVKYGSYWFGDYYSLKGQTDAYRCMIVGRWGVNSNDIFGRNNWADLIWNPVTVNVANAVITPRNFSGIGPAVRCTKTGDVGKSSTQQPSNVVATQVTTAAIISGVVPAVNAADNSLYMAPLWLAEEGSVALKGRLRGMWTLAHPASSFGDGQIIYGANEYAGKAFQLVATGEYGGIFAMEISPTVETN